MSQNDFTLANQSFPAFRADLNSALQALATNNSGGSAPSTTFANMWWYDTSNNIMYIRNEDNDAWIKFAELDQTNDKFVLSGTLQLDDGTVSAPALTFNSDTNMGIYRGGTDILKFVTAGTDAVTIDASQNVGIGVSPSTKLHIKGANPEYRIEDNNETGSGNIVFRDSVRETAKISVASGASSTYQINMLGTPAFKIDSNNDISFFEDTGSTPKLFWDSSAECLNVGTTTSEGNFNVNISKPSDYPFRLTNTSSTGYGLLVTAGDGSNALAKFRDYAGNDRVYISGAGLVGIGTSSPDAPITIQPTAQGLGTNVVQNWMYSLTSGSEFDLKLNHIVSAGLVKYSFNLRNDGTSYDNNLVLDRGNVGIGTSSPTSYANSQTTLVIEDSINPSIALSDTGQSKDYFILALGSQLSIRYADGGGSGSASNITELIKMYNTGQVTMPNQPAFQVNPSSNQLNMANGDTLIFDQEKFDQNSDFSSNTFTAPVTGKYQLQLTARVDQLDRDANWVRIEMVTSNRSYEANIIDPDAFDKDPDQWSINFSVLADMDANDTVFLRWGQSGGANTADLDTQAHFSGYLVC